MKAPWARQRHKKSSFIEDAQSQGEAVIAAIAEGDDDKQTLLVEWDLDLRYIAGFTDPSGQHNQRTQHQTPGRGTTARGLSRLSINLILNTYRKVTAHLSASYPGVVVLPASPSNEDIVKAQASEAALRYHWMADDVKATLGEMVHWLVATGTSALHTYYDPALERMHTDAVPPYDLIVEAGLRRWQDAAWCAIRHHSTRDGLAKAYPEFKAHIDEQPFDETEQERQDASHTTEVPDRISWYEVQWRDGREMHVLSDGTVLYEGERACQTFPIQWIAYTQVPGRLWGIGLIEPLVDLQDTYNVARTQVVRNIALLGNPYWLTPMGSLPVGTKITNEPGRNYPYNAANGKPHQESPVPIPSHILQAIDKTQAEMLDVSGIHSVSLGKPQYRMSGKAVEEVTQNDTSQLQLTQDAIEDAVRLMACCILEGMQKYYDKPKMMRMMDGSGSVIFKELKQTDLTEDPEVFIEAGSLFRDEAHDRDNRVLGLFSAGLLDKPDALQALSFRTGLSKGAMKSLRDMSHAKELLEAVKMNHQIEVYSTDPLDAFADVFQEEMRSREYYGLPIPLQEYIRDVYMAVAMAAEPDGKYAAEGGLQKVFPREVPPGAPTGDKVAVALTPQAPAAMEQTLEGISQQNMRGQETRDAMMAATQAQQAGEMPLPEDLNLDEMMGGM